MDTNLAAWMIAGGPDIENPHAVRDREQLHAFRESQRVERASLVARPSLLERLRGFARTPAIEPDAACCPA